MYKREILLSPIKIGTRTCENRFFIQPMECTDADTEGNPSDLTYARYENLFKGEAGLVCLEAITITDKNRSRLNQLFIMPHNQPALTRFVKRLREVNPKTLFVYQLTHSGELSNPEISKRLSVKPLPGFDAEVFTEDEFDKIMDDFVLAAKITRDSGGRENRIDVGGREKHQGRTQGKTAQHDDDLTIDVEERQKGHGHFLSLFKKWPEGDDLGLKGNHVAMRQDRRFRQTRGASCVGQDGDVLDRVNDYLRRLGRVLADQVLEREKPGYLDLLRGGYMHAAICLGQGTLSEPLLEGRKVLSDAGEDDPVELYTGLLHIAVENVLSDYCLRLTFLELMFDLLARVDRAGGHAFGDPHDATLART